MTAQMIEPTKIVPGYRMAHGPTPNSLGLKKIPTF